MEQTESEVRVIDDEQVDMEMDQNDEESLDKMANERINDDKSCTKIVSTWWFNFYKKNSLLIRAIFGILIAYAYPPLGAQYLQPQITATWIAVLIIFGKRSNPP